MRFEGNKRIDVVLIHCPNSECTKNQNGKCYFCGNQMVHFKMTECEGYEEKQ